MSARVVTMKCGVRRWESVTVVRAAPLALAPHQGKHWWQMPGASADEKKIAFAMWRNDQAKYVEENGVLRFVPLVSFGAMGCGGGMSKPQPDAGRSARAPVVKARKSRAKVVPVGEAAEHLAEAARVRALINARKHVRGLLNKLATTVPMDQNTLSRFLGGGTNLQPVRLKRLAEVLAKMPVESPGISLKEWQERRAKQLNISFHTLRMRVWRGEEPGPANVVKLSKRSFYVIESPEEEGHRERLEHRRDAETLTGGNEV